MRDIRLTRRGRIVVAVLVTLAVIVLYSILHNMTMPEECRVSIAEMSETCRTLL